MSDRFEVGVAGCEDGKVHFFRILGDRQPAQRPICGTSTSSVGPPAEDAPTCTACLPFAAESLGLPKDALSRFDEGA
jgi:hypothetical protein